MLNVLLNVLLMLEKDALIFSVILFIEIRCDGKQNALYDHCNHCGVWLDDGYVQLQHAIALERIIVTYVLV